METLVTRISAEAKIDIEFLKWIEAFRVSSLARRAELPLDFKVDVADLLVAVIDESHSRNLRIGQLVSTVSEGYLVRFREARGEVQDIINPGSTQKLYKPWIDDKGWELLEKIEPGIGRQK
jgi:hypothetical protein